MTARPIVHAVMYRDYKFGTLCDSLAWGQPMLWSAVTDQVTCPGCRTRIDGTPAQQRPAPAPSEDDMEPILICAMRGNPRGEIRYMPNAPEKRAMAGTSATGFLHQYDDAIKAAEERGARAAWAFAAGEMWRVFLRLPHTPSPIGDYVQRKHAEFQVRAALPPSDKASE